MVPNNTLPAISMSDCIDNVMRLITMVERDLHTSTQTIAMATSDMLELVSTFDTHTDVKQHSLQYSTHAQDIIMSIQVEDRVQQILSHLVSALSMLQKLDNHSDESTLAANKILSHLIELSSVDYERNALAGITELTPDTQDTSLTHEPTFF